MGSIGKKLSYYLNTFRSILRELYLTKLFSYLPSSAKHSYIENKRNVRVMQISKNREISVRSLRNVNKYIINYHWKLCSYHDRNYNRNKFSSLYCTCDNCTLIFKPRRSLNLTGNIGNLPVSILNNSFKLWLRNRGL